MNKPRKNRFIFDWTDSISDRLINKQESECRDEEKWTHSSGNPMKNLQSHFYKNLKYETNKHALDQ